MKYYKFLTDGNRGKHSRFDFTEYIPSGDQPGKWMPAIEGELEVCERGYH